MHLRVLGGGSIPISCGSCTTNGFRPQFFPFPKVERAAGVDANQTEIFRFVASVAHQTAGSGEAAILEDRGHRVPHSQSSELFAADSEEWTGADNECVCPSLDQGCKDRIKIAVGARPCVIRSTRRRGRAAAAGP